MSRLLGIPIIPISAIRNEGVGDLIHTAYEVAENKQYPKVYDFVRQASASLYTWFVSSIRRPCQPKRDEWTVCSGESN